jgi:hypothetical protein
MELMKVARATVDQFAEIPASAKDEMVQDLVDGLESVFQDYISFVASCGTKFLFFFTRGIYLTIQTMELFFLRESDDGTYTASILHNGCALVETTQVQSRATSLRSRR